MTSSQSARASSSSSISLSLEVDPSDIAVVELVTLLVLRRDMTLAFAAVAHASLAGEVTVHNSATELEKASSGTVVTIFFLNFTNLCGRWLVGVSTVGKDANNPAIFTNKGHATRRELSCLHSCHLLSCLDFLGDDCVGLSLRTTGFDEPDLTVFEVPHSTIRAPTGR